MSMIDRLLAPRLSEDITETSWWAENVFRELERGLRAGDDGGPELAASAATLEGSAHDD